MRDKPFKTDLNIQPFASGLQFYSSQKMRELSQLSSCQAKLTHPAGTELHIHTQLKRHFKCKLYFSRESEHKAPAIITCWRKLYSSARIYPFKLEKTCQSFNFNSIFLITA